MATCMTGCGDHLTKLMADRNTILIMQKQIERRQSGCIGFSASHTRTILLTQGFGTANMIGMMMCEEDQIQPTLTNHSADGGGLTRIHNGDNACLRVGQEPCVIIPRIGNSPDCKSHRNWILIS